MKDNIHTNSPRSTTISWSPVPRTGHQIYQIKSSYELFCALIWNLSHFLPKFKFFGLKFSFWGTFACISSLAKSYFAITIIKVNCDGLMRDCVLSHLGTRSNCAHGIGEGVRGRGWRGLVIDIFWGGGGGDAKKRVSRF